MCVCERERERSYESWCVVLQEVYSKRIIPTAAITGVTNVGEQKFEVVTANRTFLFKAESDCESVCVYILCCSSLVVSPESLTTSKHSNVV